MEINKTSTGNFDVIVNGVVAYQIFNGSAGMSGNGKNEYGILNVTTGKTTRAGTLAQAKKTVAGWVKMAR